jgi:hypothetical protein
MSLTEMIPLDGLAARFDEFTKRFLRDESPEFVDVEVLFPDMGAQPARRGMTLTGLTYDRRSNAVELMFESGDHRIYKPREVRAAVEPDGFMSAFEVTRSDGVKEIVKIVRYARRRIRAGV